MRFQIHPAALSDDDLLRDCHERRLRRSGPGGQNRNKVETAVVLKHEPSGIEAEANERRSQAENRRAALFRLRLKLAIAVRMECRPETTTSELWKSRCHGGRIAINPEHQDFPAILAEALDCLAAEDFDFPAASARLGCTSSQLLKLVKSEPSAWVFVNRERESRDRPRLR